MPTANELNIDTAATAQDMADAMFGDGITVTEARYDGAASASGTYTGGNATLGDLSPSDTGVILSTGNATDFTNGSGTTNTNTAAGTSTYHTDVGEVEGDTDLDAVSGQATEDGAFFEAAFMAENDLLTMQFVFTSEEYLEYVNGGVNDAFGVWVNDTYVPLTLADGSSQNVSIDTINDTSSSNLYLDNPAATDPYNTEMDGGTVVLSLTAPVNAGEENTIRIGIGDGGDSAYDSNVLIMGNSIQTVSVAESDQLIQGPNTTQVHDLLSNDVNHDGNPLTITHINNQAVTVGETITLPSGEEVSLNADMTVDVLTDGDIGTNNFTYSTVDSAGNTSTGYATIETTNTPPDFVVEGTADDDVIDETYADDAQGDRINANDHSDASNADNVTAGAGNDSIVSGDGDDTVFGQDGSDTILGGDGNDYLDGDDAVATGSADSIDGGAGDDQIIGDAGDDALIGGTGNDTIFGGGDNDVIEGAAGNDELFGESGDDTFTLEDNFGNDGILGGENGETDGDLLDLSAITTDTSIDLTSNDPEAGSVSDGASTATFSEIETVTLGGGRDRITLADGSGSDSVEAFDLSDSGDGTTNDQLDVSGLTSDGGTTPVTTTDVNVANDGSGNAVLTFPGGESITLMGVAPTSLSSINELVAIGIPDGRDYVVEGTAGDDYLGVGYGDDPESDMVDGGDNATRDNADSILAGDGNDTIIAALGDDTVDAGVGNDSARGGDGNDTLLGNAGNDTLLGESGGDSLSGGSGTDSMLGGLGDDTLNGGDDADTILGESGDDSINGDLGNDSLSGGNDSDTVAGGGGADEVFGNAGNDLLYGGSEDDTVYGGIGDDTMFGDAGDDRLEGWLGDDSMVGGAGDDYLDGADGDDTLVGQDGNDTLTSESDDGADLVQGGTGHDSLSTGDGNDTLEGGIGADSMYGGGGDDLFVLEDDFGNDTIEGWGTSETSGDTLDASSVTDDVTVDLTAFGSAADPESGIMSDGSATATFADIENIALGAGDDSIFGSDGDDMIAFNTGDGADTVDGGAGDDAFDIGADDGANDTVVLGDGDGDDTITGFEAPTINGDGTFFGRDRLDLSDLDDAGGARVNTDDVTVTDTNGDGTGDAILQFPNGESITLTGVLASEVSDPAALAAMGIAAPNYIVEGSAGHDVINSAYSLDPDGDRVDAGDNLTENNDDSIRAGAGDDTISAGLGNDSIDAGVGDDQVFAEDGNDTVSAGDGADTVFGEAGNDILTGGAGNDSMLGGVGNDALAGEIGDDTLRGEAGNDTILGGDGNDSAHGGTGDDSMSGGAGNDELHGWYGNDTLDGGAGNDYIDADLGEDLATGGDGNDTLMGGYSVESDTLQGEAGDDSIDGQAGDDLIEGGLGDDTLLGSDGDDTFILTDNFGNDSISGGETDESAGDGIDASTVTSDTTLDLTAGIASDPESGTISDGTSTASFSEIENIALGASDDNVIGSTGADSIVTGTGADTVDGGAGNDIFDLGVGDSADDTVMLGDEDGNDTVLGFEGPIDNGDATFTGRDQIDTSDLTDADGNPVLVSDVTVTDDGSGNAVLSFPNGESITLVDVSPSEVAGHDALAALGIAQSDYIVAGTAGNDLIDNSYAGDPDGDFVDNLDSQTNGNDDSIEAGAGNDTVLAGDGHDTVDGNEGDDWIEGGDGNDEIFGFEGNDTVGGGAGDDFINTRTSQGTGLPDTPYNDGGGLHYPADTDPTNDRDSVTGGSGNDTILSGDDDDTVSGGAGADSVDAGFDDDAITGDAGNDTLEGNEGADTIDGGSDNDILYGGLSPSNPDFALSSAYELENDGSDAAPANNADSLLGGDGDDTIFGQDDNDTLEGGSGDDLLDGGIDDDFLDGGTGSDEIIGGAGNDTITAAQGDTVTGGDGDDFFTLADLGETGTDSISIAGGEGHESQGDTLYLGPEYSQSDIAFGNTDDDTGGLSGSFAMNDGTVVNFSEIENIICFTPNTKILTANGERMIEDLREGDMVVTRDHGLRPIRWIGKRKVPGVGQFAPVQVGGNALEGGREGLLVSPQHRILFTGYRAELLFGETEVLVPAKHLIDGREVVQREVDEVTYIHLMFDRHEVIYAEGIATESFHVGDVGLHAVDAAAREELFAIFPELRAAPYRHGKTARPCLKAHEARLIQAIGV